MTEGAPTEFEQYLRSNDQSIGLRVFPIPNGLAVYIKDISESRRARKAVEDSEERFRLLSKATNDAIWDWDFSTDNLWWNEGLESIFGFKPDEVEPTAESWYSRIHPDEKEGICDELQRAIESNAEQWSAEYRFLRKDGRFAFLLTGVISYVILMARRFECWAA